MNRLTNELVLISVLTPTWNRAGYLRRVWEGLQQQNEHRFEWLIGDDGSTDDTYPEVCRLAEMSGFQVKYIRADRHVGKSMVDNRLVSAAKGEFIIWCDSDDIFLPGAFSRLLSTWGELSPEEKKNYCGLVALSATEGNPLGKVLGAPESDFTWNEFYARHQSDHVIFTRADLIKANPFLEVDLLIPESSVWTKIGVRKTRFIPEILQVKHYGQKNCLTFSGLMSYNRGRAYSLVETKEYASKNLPRHRLIVRLINFFRYGIHGDLSMTNMLKLWKPKLTDYWLLPFALTISLLLTIRDNLKGNVIKSHIEFDRNKKDVMFEVINLNEVCNAKAVTKDS